MSKKDKDAYIRELRELNHKLEVGYNHAIYDVHTMIKELRRHKIFHFIYGSLFIITCAILILFYI